MATARKLPSGSWRVRVYDYTDADGKKHYKSFTSATKSSCEALALDFTQNKNAMVKNEADLTFKQAFEKYLKEREVILSPATVRTYRALQRCYGLIDNIKISKFSQNDLQRYVNSIRNLSANSIRVRVALVKSVLARFRPSLRIDCTMPRKEKKERCIPNDAEIQRLLDEAQGTILELPILLGAIGTMRRGEVCGLRKSDFNGNIVHIQRDVVKNPNKEWIEKPPKTASSDRYVELPAFVVEKFMAMPTDSIPLKPDSLTVMFAKFLNAKGFRHFRFHDLRHYSASILHTMMPDAYIMERGGWSSPNVLKSVYQHTLSDMSHQYTAQANAFFEKYDTKYDSKK